MRGDGGRGDRRKVRKLSVLFSLAIGALFGLVLWGHLGRYQGRIGPQQPLPFSHRVHAGDKRIGCLLCHEGAQRGARAGVPPLETCMLCHSRIIVNFPYIRTLREHYASERPILWKKVTYLPDFVYFHHGVHLHRSIDCGACHGNVSLMDRVQVVQPFTMGFCIGCHKKNKATHDCFTCHR